MNILPSLQHYRMILASQSPRRKALLEGLGLPFEVRVQPDIDEHYPAHLEGEAIPRHIAETKAAAYTSTLGENDLVITADTIVYLDGKVFGKPADEEEAVSMLRQLSGRTHRVMTGVCIHTRHQQRSFTVTTEVTFGTLTDEEIRHYVSQYRPFDKAGAYGIQEWIGYIGVTRLDGSYFNVMGLPVQRLYQELKHILPL